METKVENKPTVLPTEDAAALAAVTTTIRPKYQQYIAEVAGGNEDFALMRIDLAGSADLRRETLELAKPASKVA